MSCKTYPAEKKNYGSVSVYETLLASWTAIDCCAGPYAATCTQEILQAT